MKPRLERRATPTMPRTSRPSAVAAPARLRVAVFADITQAFFRELVAGVAQYAREVGDWELHLGAELMDSQPSIRDWQGQGVVACLNDERVARAVEALAVPTVAVGSIGLWTPDCGVTHVDTDHAGLAAVAFEHLRERGLRSFGYYGARSSSATRWSDIRGDSFAAVAAAAGHCCDRLESNDGPTRDVLERWLAVLPKPVGILACDDAHARRILDCCRANGLRVPHEVAVVGIDNDELECELAVPPLTSIAQAARRIGHEAARLLDHRICPERFGGRAGVIPPRTLIPPEALFPRASTDTFAVADPVIARVIETVRERACRGLTIADLVDVAGLPRWKLEQQFKRAVGHSIHDDIVRVRLSEARRLISSTDLTLKAVAARSGFHSVTYMTTLFHRRFGTTPARFRRVEQGRVVRTPAAESQDR